MEKVMCTLSYDGTDFSGFQVQPRDRTVGGELESALQKIHKGAFIRVHGSGRTDSGVHAMGQVIHFETPYTMRDESWKQALNTLIPRDMYIHTAIKVPDDFHARYNAKSKEYRYYVWNDRERDVFKQNYYYLYPYPVQVSAIREACRYLEGEHDFTMFSSSKSSVKGNKVRTLYDVSCGKNGKELVFIFRGSGFLYRMVRIMTGVLLDIGQGRRKPDDILRLLESEESGPITQTAPAHGLYLWEVNYR